MTNDHLRLLRLFLTAAGDSGEIATLNDRKRVQKTVYLGQVAGVDLGYRFGWYLMGPYSPPLTQDYFALSAVEADEPSFASDWHIAPDAAKRLAKVEELRSGPPAQATPEDWLELLASVHYLLRVRTLDDTSARATLTNEKPRLAQWFSDAKEALSRAELL